MGFPLNRIRALSTVALAMVLLVLAVGCKKGEEADDHPAPSPAPDDGGGKEAKSSGGGGLSRLFKADTVATYGWDGQSSSMTLDMNTNEAYRRSISGLRAMGFVIKEEASKKEGGKSHIQGAKSDQTQVSVWIEEPAEKPGKALLHVKVGALGDRTGSERVFDEIQKVRTRPATAPVAKPAPKTAPPPANSQQP